AGRRLSQGGGHAVPGVPGVADNDDPAVARSDCGRRGCRGVAGVAHVEDRHRSRLEARGMRAMRGVPLSYIARNLWVRRVTTVLTALGMALVVYVFATVLMMSEGIRATLVATGQPDNAIVLRKGAGAEINSGVARDQAAIIESLPGIATDAQGRRLLSK